MQETYRSFDRLDELEMSTLLNVNREVYAANKAFVVACKDCFLNAEQAASFDNLPAR